MDTKTLLPSLWGAYPFNIGDRALYHLSFLQEHSRWVPVEIVFRQGVRYRIKLADGKVVSAHRGDLRKVPK